MVLFVCLGQKSTVQILHISSVKMDSGFESYKKLVTPGFYGSKKDIDETR